VVALYTVGCLFGALSCITVGDRLGRIRTMMLGAIIQLCGAIISATSYSLPQLIVGRLVSGFGLGQISAAAPTWQSECSKAEHRGATVILEGFFVSLGLATGAWVNVGASHATGPVAWRLPLGLAGVWSIWLLSVAWKLPESPRWLMKKGRSEEARQTLSALLDLPPDSEEVNASIQDIEATLEITGQGRFRDLFHNGPERLLHRTCLAALGQVFQQLSGSNALAFYQTTIFHDHLGVNAPDARIIAAGVFTWQTVCTPVGALTVDRFGRRKLLIIAAIGMGICMAIVAGTAPYSSDRPALIVAGTFIYLFSFFLALGYLGLNFLYATEVAPLSARMPINAISTATHWAFNFVTAEITPPAFADISARYYIVFVCINLFFTLPRK
jgi:sugar porter (SP) family MFS transporter